MCLTCLCDDSEVRPIGMANNNMTSQTIVTSSNNGPYVQVKHMFHSFTKIEKKL